MLSIDTILWLTLKGSAIVVLALAGTALLQRRPAAVRHALWVIAVVAQLMLPFSGWLLPARTIQVHVPLPALAESPGTSPVSAIDHQSASARRTVVPAASSIASFNVELLLAIGAALLLLRLLIGTLRIARIARRSERMYDGDWLSLVQQTAGALGIRRPVTVICSHDVRLPVTWGFIYPTILLPQSAREWPAGLRSHVLIHELAHVRRTDALTQLAGQIALALFWFNPLAWIAVRRMSIEAENACDDFVLRDGERPSVYAATLVELVRAHAGPELPAFASLSVGRRSELEQRVRAITSPLRDASTRRVLFAVAVTIGLLVMVPLSAVQRTARTAIPTASASGTSTVECRPLAVPNAPFSETSGTLTRNDGTTVHYFFLRPAPNRCIEASFAMSTRFTSDDHDIVAQQDAEALVREKNDAVDRAVFITEKNGTLERRFTLNGRPSPWNDRADRWYRAIMPEIIRRTTAGVDDRARRIVGHDGTDGLIAEISQIPMTSVRHDYLVALLTLRSPDELPRDQLIETAKNLLSDEEPELARFLADLILREGSIASIREPVIAATKSLGESANRDVVIEAMSRHRDPATRLAALDAIDLLEGDVWRRLVLERSARSYLGRDGRLVDAWFAAAAKIGKAAQKRTLFQSVLQQESDPVIQARLENQLVLSR